MQHRLEAFCVGTIDLLLTISVKKEQTMSDDPNKKHPQDASKVNVKETWEREYWSKKFGVSPEKLEETVKRVGTGAKAVEEALKK
jgi:hypothetical protein